MEKYETTELKRLIINYNNAYRIGDPIVSDEFYDSLILEYEKNHRAKDLDERQFFQSLKDPINEGDKERLPRSMGSLNKVHSIEEIKSWYLPIVQDIDKEELILTPKYDGLALIVEEKFFRRYNKRAWTRGSGSYGIRKDIHHSMCKNNNILTVPNIISYGEVLISKKDWVSFKEKYRKKDGTKYKNGRNAVAGIFNNLEPDKDLLSKVTYARFGTNLDNWDKYEQLNLIKETFKGYSVPFYVATLKELSEDLFIKLYKKWSKEFDIDGIVIDINSAKYRKHPKDGSNPKYSVAYKNNFEEIAKTKITRVDWYASKDCCLKPVATVRPVILEGAEVTHVTLYNASYVLGLKESRKTHNLGIGVLRVGTTIKLRRSGGVIPQIVEIIPENLPAEVLSELNADALPTTWHGKSTKWNSSGIELLCEVNPEVLVQRAVHFFKILKIEDIGETLINQILYLTKSSINDRDTLVKAIYNKNNDLLNVPGVGTNILYSWSQQLKEKLTIIELPTFQAALNTYEGLGVKTLELIPDKFTLDYDYSQHIDSVSYDIIKGELRQIEGISKITADNYIKGTIEFWKIIKNNYNWLNFEFKKREQSLEGKFTGKSIVFSGFRDLDLEEEIKKQGGQVKSSVSKKTSLLIVKDKEENLTTKYNQAKNLSIEIIQLDKFKEIL